MNGTFYVTSGEPRKTHQLAGLNAAIQFALARELQGHAPARVLEEVNWRDCLLPDELEAIRQAA